MQRFHFGIIGGFGIIIAGFVFAAEKFVFVEYIWYGILGVCFIYGMFTIIRYKIIPFISDSYKYYLQNKLLKKIDFQLCNNREIIYMHFTSFSNNKARLKYVNFLELYVHNVSGEWPNGDIFKITSNPANIRLAQLEEKWLGINR